MLKGILARNVTVRRSAGMYNYLQNTSAGSMGIVPCRSGDGQPHLGRPLRLLMLISSRFILSMYPLQSHARLLVLIIWPRKRHFLNYFMFFFSSQVVFTDTLVLPLYYRVRASVHIIVK